MGMMRLGVELKARSIEVSPPTTDGQISSTKKAFMGFGDEDEQNFRERLGD